VELQIIGVNQSPHAEVTHSIQPQQFNSSSSCAHCFKSRARQVGGCEVGGDAGALGARHRHGTPLSKLATLHFTMQHYIHIRA